MRWAELSLSERALDSETFRLLCLPVTCASSDPKGTHLRAVVSRTDGTSDGDFHTPEHHGQRSPVSRAGHMCRADRTPRSQLLRDNGGGSASINERTSMPIQEARE